MKMPRLAWYAAASTASAALVVVSAFHQRANFYSAMVHLAQSSLSLLVLANLVFVVYGSFMYGLQRLCFGPLRPVEVEQLYEKAWFAVTETCLAMTIFREEVGAFFLVMFTALVTGKVWGWIGEGRVEIFEQQPPPNPRLFHTRLSISLTLSIIYDTWLLLYAVNTVVQQARPTMMVMFLFEFAVLTVCSYQTFLRYIVSLVEQQIHRVQTRQRMEERRRQVRAEREAVVRRREEGAEGAEDEELPNEEDIDEMDIEVPGWESKGLWILSLDLVADFVKLGLYTAFFCVLFTFYGLPIHIIRDWFMTTRSFLKRLSALIRYRQALKDMDQYPDATPADLGQEDTCIICREEMRPWDPSDAAQVERTRAKKLPCGHILHFGCLKSWLERQQVCPTCRRPVAREGQQQQRNGEAMVFRLGLNFPAAQNQQGQPPANPQAPAGDAAPGAAPPNNQENNQNNGVRMFNFGPLRLGFAQGGANDVQELARRLGLPNNAAERDAAAPPAPTPTTTQPADRNSLEHIRAQLLEVGQRVQQEMAALNNAAHELQTLNYVVNELTRLRQLQQLQQRQTQPTPTTSGVSPQIPGQLPLPTPTQPLAQVPPPPPPAFPMFPPAPPVFNPFAPRPGHTVTTITRHGGAGYGTAIPSGSADLPEGVVIPPGWSLLPLQRLDGGAPPTDQTATQSSDQALAGASEGIVPEGVQETATPSTSGIPPGSTATVQPQTRSVPAPTVTAPTPITPNWGGSAQLFGGRAAGNPFGNLREGTPTHEDGSAVGGTSRSTAPVPQISTATSQSNGESSSSHEAGEGATDSGTTNYSKGKARAAAVEDAADEDEDDSSS